MSVINSQFGEIAKIAKVNQDSSISQFKYIIYPGGETKFDYYAPIEIEFSHYDSFREFMPDFGNSSDLAMFQINEKRFLGDNFLLLAHKFHDNN